MLDPLLLKNDLDSLKDNLKRRNLEVDLEQLMLKAYWDKLYELSVYNRQRQLQASYIREGQIIDIEVK